MSTHSETLEHGGQSDHAHEHSWKGYLYILLILLVLTIITVSASRINFGSSSANVVIAMTIATIKASLVAIFFMHLKDDKPINGLIFVSSLLFLAIFLGFSIVDADSRFDTRPSSYKGPIHEMALPTLNVDASLPPIPVAAPAGAPAAGDHGAPKH